MHSLSRH